jgi:excisionase family DNA binding protein
MVNATKRTHAPRTIRQYVVADMLGVSRWYVAKLIREGELQAIKTGGRYGPVLVPAESVDAYLARHQLHAS